MTDIAHLRVAQKIVHGIQPFLTTHDPSLLDELGLRLVHGDGAAMVADAPQGL